MEETEILNIVAVIDDLFKFLYREKQKYYFVNINWTLDNINISIKERFEKNKLLDINMFGSIETYNALQKKVINLAIKNDDVYGYLTTTNINGLRKVDSQSIKTQNLEIILPIYDQIGLMRAEWVNNTLLNRPEKINEQSNIKQKTYTNKTANM